MKILVTAGNTQTPIDQVRCLTNIFTGRTGGRIAQTAHNRGHEVCLLTSHPEAISESEHARPCTASTWQVRTYSAFADLHGALAEVVKAHEFDAVIHAAAVSDFQLAGAYAPASGTTFDPTLKTWSAAADPPRLRDVSDGKIKSQHSELWLRLVPTVKLVDRFRTEWAFGGLLVKFKLEVGASDPELLRIAEASRVQSAADLIVANTLEGMADWAYLGPIEGSYQRISRNELPVRLLTVIEQHVARDALWNVSLVGIATGLLPRTLGAAS